MSNHRARLAGAASMLAALALTATALPTMAADNDILTVTGASATTLELAIVVDDSAAFGTMRPDGSASGAEANTSYTDAAGACYVWDNGANNVQVRSNVTYDLEREVTGADQSNLRFDETVPANKAGCTGGTPVTDGSLNGDWYASQSPTTGDLYDTRLWVDGVNWTGSALNVGTTVTFTATAS